MQIAKECKKRAGTGLGQKQGPFSKLIELSIWSIAYMNTFVKYPLDSMLIPRLSIKYGAFLGILADT